MTDCIVRQDDCPDCWDVFEDVLAGESTAKQCPKCGGRGKVLVTADGWRLSDGHWDDMWYLTSTTAEYVHVREGE